MTGTLPPGFLGMAIRQSLPRPVRGVVYLPGELIADSSPFPEVFCCCKTKTGRARRSVRMLLRQTQTLMMSADSWFVGVYDPAGHDIFHSTTQRIFIGNGPTARALAEVVMRAVAAGIDVGSIFSKGRASSDAS